MARGDEAPVRSAESPRENPTGWQGPSPVRCEERFGPRCRLSCGEGWGAVRSKPAAMHAPRPVRPGLQAMVPTCLCGLRRKRTHDDRQRTIPAAGSDSLKAPHDSAARVVSQHERVLHGVSNRDGVRDALRAQVSRRRKRPMARRVALGLVVLGPRRRGWRHLERLMPALKAESKRARSPADL